MEKCKIAKLDSIFLRNVSEMAVDTMLRKTKSIGICFHNNIPKLVELNKPNNPKKGAKYEDNPF